MKIAGIDGGGTKTECLIVDTSGEVIGRGLAGPSNLRNQGIKLSAENINLSLKRAIGRKKIDLDLVFIALAAVEEEYKSELKKLASLLKVKKVVFGSDQEAAFRAGTDDDGILVIAGTGSVVRGWRNGKSFKAGGWGYLADEGSAFWVGVRGYQAIAKSLDFSYKGRLGTEFKNMIELNRWIYKDPMVRIPQLSIVIDKAADEKNKDALAILEEGAKELADRVELVTKRLGFKKEFPLVVSGGMFKSKKFDRFFKREIKKRTPFAKFIVPKNPPVFGAVKIAIGKTDERRDI